MAKLAIILRGISYYDGRYTQESPTKSNFINYKECIQSMRSNLLTRLNKIFSEIDFFIVTYDNDKLKDIRNDFKPIDEKIYPSDLIYNVDKFTIVKKLILDSLDLIEPHINKYDYILLTRFDLYYCKPFDLNTINLNKFNFGWIGEIGQCDDNFLLFHKKYIKDLRDFFKINNYSHRINCFFEGEDSYIYHYLPYREYNFYIFYRDLDLYNNGKLWVDL